MLSEHDTRKHRCPMLGHIISFSYCRTPGGNIPCKKIFDCWWETFNVSEFIHTHYDEATIQQIIAPNPSKTASLLDLIEQARKRV